MPKYKQKGRTKLRKKPAKLLAVQHTGRLRPHHHTSYGSLALILILALLPLLFATRVASADSSQTFAVVPAAVPKNAPVITNIANGKIYTSLDPISVSGSCPANTLVQIYKNEVMGGAALCQNGSFSLQMDLFLGSNALIPRASNANGIAGPDGPTVNVSMQPAGINLNGSPNLYQSRSSAEQFYITSQVFYRGAKAGDTLSWPLTIAGGAPPYSVSVNWGDDKTDSFSRAAAGQFKISHVYAKPAGVTGGYNISVKATDQSGNQSYLQLIAIVNGTSLFGTISGHSGLPGLRIAWQLLAAGIIAVLSFWIGEKRELSIIKRQPKRYA